MPSNVPIISIVIPVFNEEANLIELTRRLIKTLTILNDPFEIIFINDGSIDNSSLILHQIYETYPHHIQVIEFNKNYGQHMAIMAGFERVRGQIIVTLDADLQNPPEEIPKLVKAMKQGFDVINSYREGRHDPKWRRIISKLHNRIRATLMPEISMKDQGCMLRAYSREIVDKMTKNQEFSTFIPALALHYATHPTEISVAHNSRFAGKSNYNLIRLIRYNFDLIINFSNFPLQIFIWLGILTSSLSVFVIIFLLSGLTISHMLGIHLLLTGITLILGCLLISIGLIGEYIARIYHEVRGRPRFVVKKILPGILDS